MGLDFFKRKKKSEEHIPMPPPPVPKPAGFIGDIEEIRPQKEDFQEHPDLSIPEISMDSSVPEEPETFEQPDFSKMNYREHEVKSFEDHHDFEEEHHPAENHGPLFVSVSDYEKIDLDIKSMKTLLDDADNNFQEMVDLISAENDFLEKWRLYLEGIEKKLSFVDKIIEKSGE